MNLSNEWFEGYDDGFSAGLFIGELETESKTRVAAFGAIRRSAWIARELDREAVRVEDEFLDASDVYREARQVRRAIRAAIGSEKA